jgi:hypothetical protein
MTRKRRSAARCCGRYHRTSKLRACRGVPDSATCAHGIALNGPSNVVCTESMDVRLNQRAAAMRTLWRPWMRNCVPTSSNRCGEVVGATTLTARVIREDSPLGPKPGHVTGVYPSIWTTQACLRAAGFQSHDGIWPFVQFCTRKHQGARSSRHASQEAVSLTSSRSFLPTASLSNVRPTAR